MKERRTDFWCAFLLIVLATFFFSDVLFLGSNFWLRDLFNYHLPMKHIVRETVARGEFPWWNPYFAGGQPMAANPAYEIFYPPQWLIFLGPFSFGFALHIVFHVYVALLGMYFFLRSIPLRVEAAMFGAFSFGFSGFFLGTMTNLPTFFVWSWSGVVGWAVLDLIRTRRIAPAAIAMAMPLLVLEPIALVQMIALVIAGTTLVDRRALLRVLAAMAIAAALSAVVIIPAIDHARDSARSRGLPFDVVVDYSMPPVRPVELIAPRALWGGHVFGWRGTPYFPSIYCGLAVVLLAVAGLATRQRGSVAVIAICAISYLLAIGSHTPLFGWLYAAGLRSLRYPEKFVAAGLITLIVFAAISADRFLQRKSSRIVNLALLGLVLVDLAWFSNQVVPRMPRQFFTPPPIVRALEPEATIFHRGEWTQQSIARTYESISGPLTARNALRPFSPALWGLRTALEADVDETFLLPTHDLLDAMIRRGNSGDPHWSDAFVAISNVRYIVDYKRASIDHPILVTRVPNRGRFSFPADGRVLRASETSSTAMIDLEATRDTLMSITITRHKYWRALIDGRTATPQPSDVAYQALPIPAGRHRVELRYRNSVLMFAGAVSVLSLIVVLRSLLPREKVPRSGG